MGYIGQTPTAVPLVAGDISDGIISEAKLADDAVSLAKMKAGVDGTIISYDASTNPVAIATGSDGQVLTSAGAGQPCAFETLSAGKVLQVVETHLTAGTSQSLSSKTVAVITNFTAAITPAATSSKIMIWVSWMGETSTSSMNTVALGLKRDSTVIGEAASPSSRVHGLFPISISWYAADNDSTQESTAFQHLDSPSTTSEVVYSVTVMNNDASTWYTNRTVADSDSGGYMRGTSTLTLMEIGA